MLMKLAVDGCGEEHSGVCRGELGETVCSSGTAGIFIQISNFINCFLLAACVWLSIGLGLSWVICESFRKELFHSVIKLFSINLRRN